MARRSAAAMRSCIARLASSTLDSDSLDARNVSSIAAAIAASYLRVSESSVLACRATATHTSAECKMLEMDGSPLPALCHKGRCQMKHLAATLDKPVLKTSIKALSSIAAPISSPDKEFPSRMYSHWQLLGAMTGLHDLPFQLAMQTE